MDTRSRINLFGTSAVHAGEADLFFGRDLQSDELVRRLASRRFLAVVGTLRQRQIFARASRAAAVAGGRLSGRGALADRDPAATERPHRPFWHGHRRRPGCWRISTLPNLRRERGRDDAAA
jgi:hypothetical protein